MTDLATNARPLIALSGSLPSTTPIVSQSFEGLPESDDPLRPVYPCSSQNDSNESMMCNPSFTPSNPR